MVTRVEALQNMLGILKHLPVSDREAALIARYLTEDLFPKDPAVVFSDREERLLNHVVERLKAGEPWQYISGKAPFYGRDFFVNRHVLIPRMETEELVYQALSIWPADTKKRILDIGTGSGIIALTLALNRPDADIIGIDISADALLVAEKNRQHFQSQNVSFERMDFLDETSWRRLGTYDLIISNPPYIDQKEKPLMAASTVEFEPHMALFTRNDPMEFYQKMADFGSRMQKNAILLAEINEFRGQDVLEVFYQYGFQQAEIIKDLQGKNRIIKATYSGRFS